MNKSEKQEIAEALELSKQYLWDGIKKMNVGNRRIHRDTTPYICYALDKVSNYYPAYNLSCIQAKKIIMHRLKGSITLPSWLAEKGIHDYSNSTLQAHRLAWINLLIEEFST